MVRSCMMPVPRMLNMCMTPPNPNLRPFKWHSLAASSSSRSCSSSIRGGIGGSTSTSSSSRSSSNMCRSRRQHSGWLHKHQWHACRAQKAPITTDIAEDDWLQRSRLLVGADGLQRLSDTNILLVGLGGVGSFAAEFLARAGVGHMTVVDGDSVDTTNRNRQLPALHSTVGQLKAHVVAQRLQDINPQLHLTVKQHFLDPEAAAALVQEQSYGYLVDAIDSVAPKQALLLAGVRAGCQVVSSMGAGGRLDPSRVRLADISETYNDAFAAVVRRGLRKKGVSSGVTVVFSDELAKPASLALTQQQYKKSYFGTCSYIPALFGLYIASHIIRHAVDNTYKPPASALAPGIQGSRQLQRKRASPRQSQQSSSSSTNGNAANPATACPNTAGTGGSSASSAVETAAVVQVEATGRRDSNSSSRQFSASSPLSSNVLSTPVAASTTAVLCGDEAGPASSVLTSFELAQGVGMGFDGQGI